MTLQDNGRVQLTWRQMKGGKVGRDLLTTGVSAALMSYLHQLHRAAIGTLDADTPVWVSLASNYPGGRLTKQAIANICRDRLGVSKVHSLRHTYARATSRCRREGERYSGAAGPRLATDYWPLPGRPTCW